MSEIEQFLIIKLYKPSCASIAVACHCMSNVTQEFIYIIPWPKAHSNRGTLSSLEEGYRVMVCREPLSVAWPPQLIWHLLLQVPLVMLSPSTLAKNWAHFCGHFADNGPTHTQTDTHRETDTHSPWWSTADVAIGHQTRSQINEVRQQKEKDAKKGHQQANKRTGNKWTKHKTKATD